MLFYPGSIDWEVTPFCNHNCLHCYNYWRTNDNKSSDADFNTRVSSEYYISIAQKIIESRPVSVTITGGEPFSVFKMLKPSLRMLLHNGISVSINTNATLVSSDIIDFLLLYNIPLFVSLPCCEPMVCDKITDTSGSFLRIVTGLKKLIQSGIYVAVNMVVSKINLDYVFATARFVKEELGLDYFCATKASLPANAMSDFCEQILSYDEFVTMLKVLHLVKAELGMTVDSAWACSLCGLPQESVSIFGFKRMCSAGKFNFAVTSTGEIKACNIDAHTYGNILVTPFANAISQMEEWQSGAHLPTECQQCEALMLCGGGCRLDALITNGDITALDTTANRNNIGRNYSPLVISPLDEREQYCLNPAAKYLKEDGCVRLNLENKFEYISEQFFSILLQETSFSPTGLADLLGVDYGQIDWQLRQLFNLGLLSKRKEV